MNQKTKTITNAFAIVAIFVAFLGIFGTLALTVCIGGVAWAWQLFFAGHTIEAVLVMFGLLVVYVIALVAALEFIERKTA